MIDNILDYNKLLEQYAQNQIVSFLKAHGRYFEGERKFVMYVRRSTKGKRKSKDGKLRESQEKSIKQQIDSCQKLAKNEKITILKIYHDDESAKNANRRDHFKAMVNSIKNGTYNCIIAWHPDRLARNMKDAGMIIDLIDQGKIYDLKFPTFYFSRDTNGVMSLGIQFVMAKQYSDNLSQNVTRGSVDKAQLGKPPSGTPSHGYVVNGDGYLRPDGQNFQLLKRAFEKALQRESQTDIAKWLNENNYSFKGKIVKMTKQKLSDHVFSKTLYAGLYVYSTETINLKSVDPDFEPMVTPEQFIEVRNIYNSDQSFQRTRSRLKLQLLRNMVICDYCNKYMIPSLSQSGSKKKDGSDRLYLILDCKNPKCYAKKQGIRSFVFIDQVAKVLKDGVKVTKKQYDDYINQAKQNFKQDIINFEKNIKLSQNKINQITDEIRGHESTRGQLLLNNPNYQAIFDEITELVQKLYGQKNILKNRIKDEQQKLASADYAFHHRVMSYESFSNYFENIGDRVKNTDNHYELDQILKMVVSNFLVRDKKILSIKLNPHFQKLLELNRQGLWSHQDSNLGPHECESCALTN